MGLICVALCHHFIALTTVTAEMWEQSDAAMIHRNTSTTIIKLPDYLNHFIWREEMKASSPQMSYYAQTCKCTQPLYIKFSHNNRHF